MIVPWGNKTSLEGDWVNKVLTDEAKEHLPKSNPLVPCGRIWVGYNPSWGRGGAADAATVERRVDFMINKLHIKSILTLQQDFEFQGIIDFRAVAKSKSDVTLLKFPIKDLDVADDEKLVKFLVDLIPKIAKGTFLPMYIHCKGGNGRTGTVVSLILAHLYGLDAETSMKFVNDFHDRRKIACYTSPETDEQMDQVRRLVPILNKRLKEK